MLMGTISRTGSIAGPREIVSFPPLLSKRLVPERILRCNGPISDEGTTSAFSGGWVARPHSRRQSSVVTTATSGTRLQL